MVRVVPSVKSLYEHWRGFFPLSLINRALLSIKRDQKEAGLRDQICNLAPCPLPSLMVIQAQVKKVRHRAATIVISQKQGQKEALAPGEPALSSRAGRPLCNTHGELLPPEAGREGISLPDISAAAPRLQAFPRHSGAKPGPKWVWRPEQPRTGGNPLPWGQDCISKGWQELCRWKAWSPHSAATQHVWHSGKNRATNTQSVVTPRRVKPRLGTGTSVTTSLVGEGLPQPCCAVEGVVKEGRTQSSLQFPISFLAQAHTHPLTTDPSQSFLTLCSYHPGVHNRTEERLAHRIPGYQLLKCW